MSPIRLHEEEKWRTLRKTGSYWTEKYATSQLRRSSRAEVNKFLLAHVTLFKRVYFRQYFVRLRERIFSCCSDRITVKLKLTLRDRIAAVISEIIGRSRRPFPSPFRLWHFVIVVPGGMCSLFGKFIKISDNANIGELSSGSYSSLSMSLSLLLSSPHPSLHTCPFPHPPFPFPWSLPLPIFILPLPISQIQQGGLGSAVSSPSRSGQSLATKRILVQRRPKLGIWRWVDGLAKWVNLFMFTIYVIYNGGQDPIPSQTAVLTDSRGLCAGYFVNEQFNHFSRSCCWSYTLCSSHFSYDLRQKNSCVVANLVFNLIICHFKPVFSDCAG